MKKRTGVVAAAGVLCLALLTAGCGGAEGEASASSAKSTSQKSTTESSSGAISVAEGEASASKVKGNYEYISGDVKLSDCLVLPEYKGIPLTIEKVVIDDAYIEDYIHAMMQPEKVEDPEAVVQDKDTVIINYEGTIDGKAFEGGTAEDAELIIGSGSFISGFEDGLIGMKAGEERDLELYFPDDYWNEDLAGLPVNYHVTLKEIRRYPEITDEKVSEITNGEYTDKDSYWEYIRQISTEGKEKEVRETLKQNAWGVVYDGTEFKALPESYVQEGMDRYTDIITQEAAYYGVGSVEEYVEAAGMTMDEYETSRVAYGEEIAKSRLIAEAIWEAEGCTREDPEYLNYQENIAASYGYTVEEFLEMFGEDMVDQYCVNMVALDILVDNAKITYTE